MMQNDEQNDETNRVAPLGDLDDFTVAEGYPDVRGWDVLASDGQKVGEVHELIVDTAAMRTRYLDVRIDKKLAASDDDREVLVPIGSARVDESDDHILLDSMTASQVIALPAYDKDAFSRDYETSLLPNFDAGAVDMTNGGDSGAAIGASESGVDRTRSGDFYDTHHFDDSRFFSGRNRRRTAADVDTDTDTDANTSDGDETRLTRSEEELEIGKRRVEAGEVDVRKTVETEHVSRPVTRRREEVTIERRPVSGTRAAAADLGEDEIRIPIIEEEIVVEKRPVVKEEIVIRKTATTEEKTVEADLRKERIDVDDSSRTTRGRTTGRTDEERGR